MAGRREREVEFSQPVRQVFLMVLVLAAVGAIGWFLYDPIRTVFEANLYLNGLIVGVFAIGVIAVFRSVVQLVAAVSWIESFAADRPGHEFSAAPSFLTSLSTLLRDQRARTRLNATSARTILDSTATRLDESRDITRYLGNLLIFLGLLGTFWGLSNTVPAVVDTIRSLAPDADGGAGGAFDRLMAGLENQLGGMGTAFASSLLGLAGSLVIGLLELFAGHAQNRFYRELEEWISSITRIGLASDGEGGGDASAALIEQSARQVEAVGELLAQGEARRRAFEDRISELTESVSRLVGETRETRAAREDRLVTAVENLAERLDARSKGEGDGGFGDQETRARLRSIDRQLLRLLEELAAGRQDSVAELRADLNGLARILSERR